MSALQNPGDRASNELSYNFSRASMIDSMLSSLSDVPSRNTRQASLAYDGYTPSNGYSASQQRAAPRTASRRRDDLRALSNSDYDSAHVDELALRYADFHANGRQSSRHTIRQVGDPNAYHGVPASSAESHAAARGSTRARRTGSGSSSVDLGHSMAFSPGTASRERSASLDSSYSSSRTFKQSEPASSNIPYDYAPLDAAPTPNIPAGPRRPEEWASHLGQASAATSPGQSKQSPSQRSSLKAPTVKNVKKSKSSAPVGMDTRDQAKQYVLRSAARSPQPVNESPRSSIMRKTTPSMQPAAKEPRPGFFRRVFGSAKYDKMPIPEDTARPPSPAAVRRASLDMGGKRASANVDRRTSSKPAAQDIPTAALDLVEHSPAMPLRKAHSSFFRRRKRSFTEPFAPPMPRMVLRPQDGRLAVAPAQDTDNTSLAGAMAPYLSDIIPESSDNSVYHDSREQQCHETPSPRVGQSATMGRSPFEAEMRPVRVQEGAGRLSGAVMSNPGSTKISGVQNHRLRVEHQNVTENLASSPFHEDVIYRATANHLPRTPDETRAAERNAARVTSDPQWSQVGGGNDKLSPRTAHLHEKGVGVSGSSPLSDRLRMRSFYSEETQLSDGDDDEVVLAPERKSDVEKDSPPARLWLQPSSSEEKLGETLRQPPSSEEIPQVQRRSPSSYQTVRRRNAETAASDPHLQADGRDLRHSRGSQADLKETSNVPEHVITDADRERARRIFEGDEQLVSKAGAAAWLGQLSPESTRTRKAYMELFDWSGENFLSAFRELCERLVVRAESQQLDRVIEAFAERWCDCNPNHGFKDRDVVHTIVFSILMLNTDLHIAELDQRMTRSQFVKNTLPTTRSIADAAASGAADTIRTKRQQLKGRIPWEHPDLPSTSSPDLGELAAEDHAKRRPSVDAKRNRLSRMPGRGDPNDDLGTTDACNILVKAPYEGGMKGWELQVELVLKEFYNSIRQQRLPLHGHVAGTPNLGASVSSQGGLSLLNSSLRRSPSLLSKAPSENASYRGRSTETGRFNSGRFASKARSRPRIYPSSTMGSSRTSLDEQSFWSPAGSMFSKYSVGKTQTSLSVESFGSQPGDHEYQKAIGFANALSQATLREEGILGSALDDHGARVVPLLDDTLELAGPPWAKEGMVKHKHHLESLEKKAKDRNWAECFAVVEKGWFRMFAFVGKNKYIRPRAKSRHASSGASMTGAVVGGGNWTENAQLLDEFLLRQTIASELPRPGYSKSRPHVFALSLPTGAVHLFQVGTAEIVQEFVSTTNYWSARLSKPPLVGGVSNIEYGWSENLLHSALPVSRPDSTTPASIRPGTSSSNQSGFPGRSSLSSASGPLHAHSRRSEEQGAQGYRARHPGERVTISEWSPPNPSMMASQLLEVDQLRELTTYVENVEEELKKHNDLRPLMGMAFPARHPNATKAMANWERKSAYLLSEIVKFKTYVDNLRLAQEQKLVFDREREEREQEKLEREREREARANPASPTVADPEAARDALAPFPPSASSPSSSPALKSANLHPLHAVTA